jgi:hypothetical protein
MSEALVGGRYEFIAIENQTSIKDIWIEVRTVRPRDSTKVRIDPDLCKVGGIVQRSKYATKVDDHSQVDDAFDAIFKPYTKAMTFERTGKYNIL